jgi:hypothetical protein
VSTTQAVGTSAQAVDPLSKLTADRGSLEASSDFWSVVLVVATVVVAVGVAMEFAEELGELWEAIRGRHKLSRAKQVVFLGTLLVIGGVAAEFWAEFRGADFETKLRGNNEAAQGVLDARARAATKAAVDLTAKFGGLQGFVDAQERQMDAEMGDFRAFADSEKRETKAVIGDLNRNRADLAAARLDAQSAAAASKRDLAEVATLLEQERELRQRIVALTTPRALSPEKAVELADSLRPFANTSFDMYVTNDPDSVALVNQIGAILKNAGWQWKPAASIGALSLTGKNPQISIVTVSGVSVEIAESAKETLGSAVLALVNGLRRAGIAASPIASPDEHTDKKFDKSVVHVVIGSR